MKWLIAFLLIIASASAHLGEPENLPADVEHVATEASCYPADEIAGDANPWVLLLFAVAVASFAFAASTKQKTIFALLGVVCFIAAMTAEWHVREFNSDSIHFGIPGKTHLHADFALVVNNQQVDFTNEHYFTFIGQERSKYVHLHDPDHVVHVHASGVTWEYFFKSIGVTMNDSCMDVKGTLLCNSTFLINDEQISTLRTQIQEGDRALFHYGAGNASIYYPQVVGNNSCLHSGTCPERGFIPGCGAVP